MSTYKLRAMQNRILNFNDRILDFIGFMFNQFINKSQILLPNFVM